MEMGATLGKKVAPLPTTNLSYVQRSWEAVAGINSLQQQRTFSVLQWNTLADALSDAFPHAQPDILKWGYRKQLLVQQIVQLQPDLIALEEVDHFSDYFLPALKDHGYDGIFQKKPSNGSADGTCIFWKTDHFTPLENKITVYKDSNQTLLLVLFQDSHNSENRLIFGATHLKAKVGFEKEREAQSSEILSLVKELNTNDYPVIICGDFNDTPDSMACATIKKGNFASSYAYPGDEDASWTTWKKRKEEVRRTIDYIWFSGLNIHSRLAIPDLSLFPVMLPAPDYASDHLAIGAQFSFLQNNSTARM